MLIEQLSIATTQYACNIFVHFISKPSDPDKMGMRLIRNNSAGKKSSNIRNI